MLTFSQKQIRNEKKREKNAIAKFKETNDVSYMRKADSCKEKWMELERNQMVDRQKKMTNQKEKNMSEDEAFQEAEEYNRIMKEEGEEKKRLLMEKEANIKELRMKSRSLLKEKQEQKKKHEEKVQSLKSEFNKTQENHKTAFFKKMNTEHTEMSVADIQKKFRRYQFDREKREQYKQEMKFVFTLKGIKESEINKKIEEYFEFLKDEKQKNPSNFSLDFELDDYIEGYDKKMIEEKVSDLEEPISEEEVETHSSL